MKQRLNLGISSVRILGAITAIAILSAAVSCARNPRIYTSQFLGTFDTVVSITAHGYSEAEFDKMSEYTESRFKHLHQLFDIYNDYDGINNIKTINDRAGISPVSVDPEIIRLLTFSIQWYEQTDGKFNIALGSVLKIWHDYRLMADPEDPDPLVPSEELLREAARHTSIESIHIDEEAATVYLSDPKVRIDVGAVAKGYTAELVARELIASGHTNFALNAGGNIRVSGAPIVRGNEKWIIGVQNPKRIIDQDPNADLLAKVMVTDMAVVTSGWYQRYYISGGTVYHHIIDPGTLMPQNYYQAVTVLHPDSGVCDILSTVLMLLPPEELSEWMQQHPETEAIWVMPDGELIKTGGIDHILKKP